MIVRFQAALNYPIRDYFLEIRQRLRENEKVREEILLRKLRKLLTFLAGLVLLLGPKTGYLIKGDL